MNKILILLAILGGIKQINSQNISEKDSILIVKKLMIGIKHGKLKMQV